jgi:hypothetical protein
MTTQPPVIRNRIDVPHAIELDVLVFITDGRNLGIGPDQTYGIA